ncbi:unnamed protein product [Soboliphyme baturini]|uniref:FZ domain-containing protein n=1 Tax=Soboliphyme baturini TaxID=241478 RepID=A0A183ICJ6_9BILA|nr:unnamed protein product [Soboliphyme baturini]
MLMQDVNGQTADGQERRNTMSKVRRIVEKFFVTIFPPVYACVINADCPRGYNFKANYSACVRDAFLKVEPFSDIPVRVGLQLELASNQIRGSFFVMDMLWETLKNLSRAKAEEFLPGLNQETCLRQMFRYYSCSVCLSGINERMTATLPCRRTCQTLLDSCLHTWIHQLEPTWFDECGPIQTNEPTAIGWEKKTSTPVYEVESYKVNIRSVKGQKVLIALQAFAQNLSYVFSDWFSRIPEKICSSRLNALPDNSNCVSER